MRELDEVNRKPPLTRSGRRITVMPWVTPRWLLKELWRAKVDAAAIRYSQNPCTETMAAYRSVLKTFADLVLRGKSPDETPMDRKQKPR
jgi:hypothetical protein